MTEACAGMTEACAGMTEACTGMTVLFGEPLQHVLGKVLTRTSLEKARIV
jgi:hypothetical protein